MVKPKMKSNPRLNFLMLACGIAAIALALVFAARSISVCHAETGSRKPGEEFLVTGSVLRDDVQFGNANLEGASRKNWFVGHFLDVGNMLKTDDVELKWSENEGGTTNGDVAVNNKGHTICILISGKHRVDFGDQQVLLEKRGDYVIWGPGVPHTWTAVTDAVVLTLRWPSLPGDQKVIQDASSQGFAKKA